MSKFKVGDKVRIVRPFDDDDFPAVGWASDMQDYVNDGITYTISGKQDGPPERYLLQDHDWCWVADSLELVSEVDDAKVQKEADAIIHDAMLFRAMLWWHGRGRHGNSAANAYKHMAERRLTKQQESEAKAETSS
jgi:hypothetical protein